MTANCSETPVILGLHTYGGNQLSCALLEVPSEFEIVPNIKERRYLLQVELLRFTAYIKKFQKLYF